MSPDRNENLQQAKKELQELIDNTIVSNLHVNMGIDLRTGPRAFTMKKLIDFAAEDTYPIKVCTEKTFAVVYDDRDFYNDLGDIIPDIVIIAWWMSPHCKLQHVLDFFEHRFTP